MSSLDGPEEYPDYPYGPHRCEDQWRHEQKADEAGQEECAKGHRSPPYGSEQTEELHGIVSRRMKGGIPSF